ncbi:UDP-N-acetylglucosamine--peptide N-acetylglucosaminyltransferase SEC [Phytophthora nicotianae]|uniref:UDP-N-acetylglucosamine--peptide N-acetylglucosaminyltransferase SEC n=1 Tax=Phytophthora nicotianae TaxID=4792 RepID=A0A0W8DKU2_PHYNI|nr:UDP-N-acetylglucosamine--peptide N-acetylglucosaminyltransferase SEC [Phytophthora nicotianae]
MSRLDVLRMTQQAAMPKEEEPEEAGEVVDVAGLPLRRLGSLGAKGRRTSMNIMRGEGGGLDGPNYATVCDVQRVHARDIRRMENAFSVSNEPAIIIRKQAILISAGTKSEYWAVDKKAFFSDEDEEFLTILAAQAGVALNNADTHTVACIARERVKDVLSIVQDMHRDLGFISLMFTISTRVQRFVNSDRCTLYIVDRAKNELWTLQGEVNIRVPINQGIAGAVAMNNEAINLENAYDDPRFNKDFDQKLGYQTRSVLAMPLRNGSGEVIAVVQLINKLDASGVFSTDDEELLGTFLQIAGPILFNSHSHLKIASSQNKEEVGTEFTGKSTRGGQEIVEMNVISENDEEEA